jgi:DprA winged helix domain
VSAAKPTSEEAVAKALASGAEMTSAEIATATGLGRSMVSEALTALERGGTVRRHPGGRDGRRRLPDRWSIGRPPERDDRARAATQRLRPGQFDGLVLDYIDSQGTDAVGPPRFAKALGRSGRSRGELPDPTGCRRPRAPGRRQSATLRQRHRGIGQERPFAKGEVMKVIGLGLPDDVRVRFDAPRDGRPGRRPSRPASKGHPRRRRHLRQHLARRHATDRRPRRPAPRARGTTRAARGAAARRPARRGPHGRHGTFVPSMAITPTLTRPLRAHSPSTSPNRPAIGSWCARRTAPASRGQGAAARPARERRRPPRRRARSPARTGSHARRRRATTRPSSPGHKGGRLRPSTR